MHMFCMGRVLNLLFGKTLIKAIADTTLYRETQERKTSSWRSIKVEETTFSWIPTDHNASRRCVCSHKKKNSVNKLEQSTIRTVPSSKNVIQNNYLKQNKSICTYNKKIYLHFTKAREVHHIFWKQCKKQTCALIICYNWTAFSYLSECLSSC